MTWFLKYVPKAVVQMLACPFYSAELGGSRRNLAIFFSADIVDFSSTTENLDLSVMTEMIQNNQETVDKFIGDSIMAI